MKTVNASSLKNAPNETPRLAREDMVGHGYPGSMARKEFMMKKNTLLTSAIAALLVTACASIPPEQQLQREMVGVSGKSALFTTGYRDGCQSGLSAGGNRTFAYAKDLSKANLPDYRLGWEDGFRVCQSRQVQRNNERNSYDGFGYPYPWFPRTGITIGVEL